MYSLTIFKTIFDNKTDKRMDFDDWSGFESLLVDLSKENVKSKKEASLISPAVYLPNTTRANANVTHWAKWAAVDVDDYEIDTESLQEELNKTLGDYYYVCYSTASSTTNFPKFRIVFPLTDSVAADDIKHFWFALNSFINSMGDKQTKDLSRMYYIPANYDKANNFLFINKGKFIEPLELMAKYPYRNETRGSNFFDNLPDAIQKEIVQYRKDQSENNTITWTSYHDCPFVNKGLVAEYKTTSNTGWYHLMYKIMVSIAGNAIRRQYPITAEEVEKLCKELDMETGNWYENRPLIKEANRAIEFCYKG
jgi:hypothetical protein